MFQCAEPSQDLERGPPQRTAGPGMALALPLLTPLVLMAVFVESLSLAPTDVPSGAASIATVTLDPTALVGTTRGTSVLLSSSNTSVATVPATVLVPPLSRTATFTVSTRAGVEGCTTISARVGTTAPQTQALFVQPPVSIASPLQLRLPNFVTYPGFEGGPSFANLPPGTVAFTQIDRVPRTVQLAISSPVASIPGTVTVPSGARTADFPIVARSVPAKTCAIITATSGISKARALLRVFPPA